MFKSYIGFGNGEFIFEKEFRLLCTKDEVKSLTYLSKIEFRYSLHTAIFMKTLLKKLGNYTITEKSDYFSIRGRNIHLTIFYPVFAWCFISMPCLFSLEFGDFLGTTAVFFSSTVLLLLGHNFEIRIDRCHTVVKLKLWFIPFYVIKVKTKDLIIPDFTAEGIQIISQQENPYCKDVKNNLKFDYIMPFEEDNFIFYIDYKGREIDFNVQCNELVWNSMITGLRNLDKK
ncbi:MAG: hypothetical protein WBP45_16010 [Daejeonella sp.]